ncbi:MAG: T9SS type A sorting domain-containing protein [Saprospiraceae bacterium]|nr:T9SS type A sorting domain-containing protein [Saprospiraceae bacterium]
MKSSLLTTLLFCFGICSISTLQAQSALITSSTSGTMTETENTTTTYFTKKSPAEEDETSMELITDLEIKDLDISIPRNLDLTDARLQIIDMHGVVLKQTKIDDHCNNLNIQDLPLGVYFVRIQSKNYRYKKSFKIHRSHKK